MNKIYISVILGLSLLGGCATVPSLRISQPWIRTLKSNQSIETTHKIKVVVNGTTSPLLGSEQLESEQLKNIIDQLLERRGFIDDESKYDYIVKFSYKSERHDFMQFSSTVATTNSQAIAISTGSGAGATSGLGVSIARAIGAIASRSSTVGTQSIDQSLSYTHTIAIEISNRDGSILWQGQSTWDSQELNLINRIIPALQLILSDLPSDKAYRPDIPEVKETHVLNYYRLECKSVWFSCPALPYRILFVDTSPDNMNITIPTGIKDQKAFAAYVDLIQTAEYALPGGTEKDWKDPLDLSLWKNVILGGQYQLGPEKESINILIELTGKTDGYYVDNCKIASDKEYSEFSDKLSKWREALHNYYDVYKH